MQAHSYQQHDIPSKSYSDDDSHSLDYYPKYYQSSFREHRSRKYDTPRNLNKFASSFPQKNDQVQISHLSPPNILSLQVQEIVLIQDLFNVLLGFQGNYISLKRNMERRPDFFKPTTQYVVRIHTGFDNSLLEMAYKISEIAINYMEVSDFIELYSSPLAGQVNQALTSALKHFEIQYIQQVVDLEVLFNLSTIYNPFTLLRLSSSLSSQASIMYRLSSLTFSIYKQSYSIELKNSLRDQELGLSTSADPNVFSLLNDNSSMDSLSGSENDSSNSQFHDYDSLSSDYLSNESHDSDSASNNRIKKRLKAKKSNLKKRLVIFKNATQKINVRGGATLNVITHEMKNSSGDQISSDLYSYILSTSVQPFLSLLRHWLYSGVVEHCSPTDFNQKEFMISRSEGQTAAVVAGSDEFVFISNAPYQNNHLPNSSSPKIVNFTLNENLIPDFLQSHCRKILLTGKYINVVKECCHDSADTHSFSVPKFVPVDGFMSSNESDGLMKAINGNILYKEIDSCYSIANTSLLQVLFKDSYLRKYLDAAKRYLLLDQADFLTSFFDLAGSTLERFATDEVKDRLSSYLDSTLKNTTSSTYSDPFKDKISLSFSNEKLIDALSLLQSNKTSSRNAVFPSYSQNSNSTPPVFPLDNLVPDGQNVSITCSKIFLLKLSADFPASLVLSPISMRKYSLIHRHILILKLLEWKLSSAWISHLKTYSIVSMKKRRHISNFDKINAHNSPAVSASDVLENQSSDLVLEFTALRLKIHLILFSLRNKMLLSIQQILYFLFFEVLEPNWVNLLKATSSAKTVDELIASHNQFLDSSLLQCGLTNQKLFKSINRLISMCNYLISNTSFIVDSSSSMNSRDLSFINSSSSELKAFVPTGSASNIQNINQERPGAFDNEGEFYNRSTDVDGISPDAIGTVQSIISENPVFNQMVESLKMLQYVSSSFNSTLTTLMEALNHYAQSQSPKYLNLASRLDFIKNSKNQ
ncbi:Spindle pole body component alp4 [Smittium mucronatum]|uniref:Spindle pole body component n=1 Tax=Smittium mucronatum TaxID=133383 RepID=A0A1R0GZJ4_9FUNG|nr:Spindle pole body component alp4 [Smittium mucronatum]